MEQYMRTWNLTAQALPQDGDLVQFVVERHNMVLHGVYEESAFKSRWSNHPPADVSEWRKTGESPASWALVLKIRARRPMYVPAAA